MYMPVLNKKAGEMAALGHTSEAIASSIIPLIMIHDVDKDDIKKFNQSFQVTLLSMLVFWIQMR